MTSTGQAAVKKQTPCSHEYFILEGGRQLINKKIGKSITYQMAISPQQKNNVRKGDKECEMGRGRDSLFSKPHGKGSSGEKTFGQVPEEMKEAAVPIFPRTGESVVQWKEQWWQRS